ncbi:PAS domain-containing sensor histidine kinase [Algoriphagus halophytocola]|uniref:histidine kinase n=1 Tax=Algoriphagus halophytocola TaxID=2991499 RepID=A0ABY6MD66_9BACT|nr:MULTISPECIES: PAS domain-containing sensor histidine kinase [unclassified Algoriphagus]UZD21665.1 PAS domain-containing sensor histidine kinase [Algoriphagus sp. TR-M5]WBL42877.1 PAS domain-containing sensor histidine kinase [Algoriphagus sp. TR-M9]
MNPEFSNYSVFFDQTPDLVCIAGYDGYFKKINPAVPQALGYTYEELYSKPIKEFIHPADRDKTATVRDELLRDTTLTNFENRYLTKSGEIVWLSWTSQPIADSQVVFAIAKNITQKKQLENDRNALLTNLTEINKGLRHLGYMTSHDLRSPVSNILSIFELIDSSKITDPETLEYLDLFKVCCEDLKEKLDQFSVDLKEKQSLHIPFENILLEDVVNRISKSIGTLLQISQAQVDMDFEQVPSIHSNQTYLESIFLNLISNSIKYKKAGARPHIKICSSLKNGFVHLTFADNGIGFDMTEVKDKIFGFQQTFHQNSDSRGIGLYLVYNHVQSLGGKIKVDSTPGVGTIFTLILKP